ncbi:Gfo/Idh/MocA family oxidoreductase [Verrucomicrobiales bacterium]|nr:Gfo/Idh/MocA family oxidoreductase [Verrucomicrobiales bacterium]
MIRRKFLKTVAAAPFVTTGLVAAPPSGKLRHASFGGGGMALADLEALSRSPHIEVAAIADVDSKRAAKAIKRYPKAKFYTDWRELLEKEGSSLDSVNVSTPDHMHGAIGLASMDLGLHCYGQKPLAQNLRECRAMVDKAREKGVVTQMGIQVSSDFSERFTVEIVQSGKIGKIERVHSFSNKKWGGDGKLPAESDTVPKNLDWDAWLGVAKERPYIKGYYHPENWRKRRDFGTGTFGDMGCHIFSGWYRALGLTSPSSLTSRGPASNQVDWAIGSHIDYEYPATPFTSEKGVTVTWYDGDARPPEDVAKLVGGTLPSQGSVIIGSEGVLLAPHMSTPSLFPKGMRKGFRYPKLEPRDHYLEWVEAARGATDQRPSANYEDYAGALTESVLIGCLGTLFPNEKLVWDSAKLEFVGNEKADAEVGREYRKGWEIDFA